MLTEERSVATTGIDAVALKPSECDLRDAEGLPVDTVTIDYEGREHLPDAETLEALAEGREVRVTTPVRADGFDPLGDDRLAAELPGSVGRVLVAGHPAYLSEGERARTIAPRLGAALEAAPGAWVGTEGIKRLALATGATQFELLSRSTERDVRSLRAAGFEGGIAVYAPTVLADDEDRVLDAVGAYVARRGPVARALPDDPVTDGRATGRTREALLAASADYALAGGAERIRDRVRALKDAGADVVIGYPARGIEGFID